MAELQKNKVITTYTKVHTGRPTNYHFVLWYDVDRTILVNHVNYDYSLPKFPAPKWIYLTSVASNSLDYQFSVIDYIEQNPKVRLAFQPGTYQLKLGPEKLSRIYKATDVLVVNLEEARRITSTHTGSTSAPAPEVRSQEHIQYIKNLLNSIGKLGPKLTIITDSHNGAYMHDGDLFYHMPIYPDPRPPFERTGCGDAFTATFVSALALGLSPVEALMWAPVNPMSVAQFVGSQEGLLKREQLEWWLERAPEDYKPRGI
jgi:sugar/nucleoside kinase (ribokinase family)